MNIYLHVEISSRELDSKILLATLAASRGHDVIISDLSTIKRGLFNGTLPPGIFHTKSLTPNNEKMDTHEKLVKNGFIITSIDEEGGLLEHGYSDFAKLRYSEHSIEQSSAIFGWGEEDTDSLKKIYSKHSNKIYKTGSPRVDLWRSNFSSYWNTPDSAPNKPFLLISSNLYLANYIKPFYEWGGFKSIGLKEGKGYFQSDPKLFKKQFYNASEDHRKLAAFIEAVHYLSKFNNGYEIVVRPHPLENIEAWKSYLKDVPNVHVLREGSINSWVNNAFAVMHNSCTTALEASVSNKPVITYIPFKQDFAWEIPNKLGYQVNSLEELLNRINTLFNALKSSTYIRDKNILPGSLLKKLYIDESELAAEKMINVWESLKNNNLKNNLKRFQWYVKIMNLKNIIRKTNEDPKFPSLIEGDVQKKVNSLLNILKIDKKLKCEIFSNRTILIKNEEKNN